MTASQELRRSWRVLIAAAMGLGLSGGASLYWFGVMVTPLTRTFGWTTAQISGWALLVHGITYLLAPIAGGLVDQFGARRLALLSIALVIAGFVAVGAGLSQLWMLYAGAAVIGVSNSFLSVYTRTINTWFSAGRGIALGIAYGGAGVTSIFGPRLTLYVVDRWGWRAGFIFMGGLTLLPLPAVAAWLREKRFSAGAAAAAPESGSTPRRSLAQPAFWLIGGGCLLYFLAYNGIQFGLVPLLTHQGMSRSAAANYAGLMGLFILAGKLLSGITFDRFRMAAALGLFLLADAAAMAVLSRGGAGSAALCLVVIGFVQGAVMNGFPFSVARYFGIRYFGAVSGLISVLLSVSSFGSVLFSGLHDRSGGYTLPLMVAAGILAAASVLLFGLGRQRYFAAEPDAAASAASADSSSAVIRSTS